MRPFMLSVYGRAQQIYTRPEDRIIATRLVENINQQFIGLGKNDCIQQFLNWMVTNKFMWSDYDLMELGYGRTPNDRNSPRLYNYIFAHNGFGFDFRFMYNQLHQHCSEFIMVGDMTNTKMLQGGGIFLLDYAQIYKEKLDTLARTFFKEEEGLWKDKNDDVKSLDYTVVEEWLSEYKQTEVPCERMKNMMTYNV